MYCTAREHLENFANRPEFGHLLQLYYGIAYALQMIGAGTNEVLK